MGILQIFLISTAVLYFILLAYFAVKSGRFFKTLLIFSGTGLIAFAALEVSGIYTGVSLAVNLWTAATSILLGIPGLLGMLGMRMFF